MRIRPAIVAFFFIASAAASAAAPDDTKPKLDTSGVNMQPAYPASALATREQGAAVFDVQVNAQGKVTLVRLRRSSGFNDLDSAAIAAVMGWHFIPATSNGANVAGVTTMQIAFQPPEAAPASAPAPAAPPQPDVKAQQDYLPASLDLTAAAGEYDVRKKDIPCANGTVTATVQVMHGKNGTQYPPSAALMVYAGDDLVQLLMFDHENFMPPVASFFLRKEIGGKEEQVLNYSHIQPLGTSAGMSLSWNPYGLITGRVGEMQLQQTPLSSQPTSFSLFVSSGSAKFTDPQLICAPTDMPTSAK